MAVELVSAVSGLVGPAIEVVKLIYQPIRRQFNYLCCFTTNINSLKEEFQNLDDALAGLEVQVQAAQNNVQEPLPEVKTWLAKSKNIKDEINGILNEAENVGSGCSKLGARFSLSKRAKKTAERTEKLRGEKPKAEFQPPPIAATQGVQLGKIFECESRNKFEEDIMTTIRGGDVNMIGICGMGGVGKTTMAKKIRNRVLDENVFQEVAMAVVSQQVDKSKIQVEIGGSLGLDLKDDSSESRVQKLHARLRSTKRSTLLILDDVWERLVLEDFGIPRDSKGCTILLTSRDSGVLHEMGVQIFGMKVLSDEEAWSFFRERVGTCVDDRKLNPIAEEVVKECKGLPIALEIVSALLKDEDDVSIWEDALRQLSHSDPDIPEFISKVYNPLKLSYDGLRSEQAKSLFLLFCLFSEDANIPLEYLTYFCMGLRIYKGVRNLIEARNRTRALTKMLKSRSLLLDSDKEDHVRMHDVVRDVCIFIAKEKGYIGKDGCTWISSSHLVGERNEILSGSTCPNLCLLFLDGRYDDSLGFKFDDAYVKGMRELHMLCIVNYFFSLTTLPHPTQSLGKLNTLILESCRELKTISVVGEMVNLEILICRDCDSIEKLPSEMKGLNCLKVLELTGCWRLQSIERDIISSLVGLEELKMRWSFNRWEAEEREERENAGLRELEALPNLACLEIDIQDASLLVENMPLLSKKIVRFIIRTDDASVVMENMPRLLKNIVRFIITVGEYYDLASKFSKKMSLHLERETRLGDWIEMQLLRDTEYLHLRGDGANNVDLAKTQNIRWLELKECESMKNVVRTSGGDDATVFPLIEHLSLYSLPQLQEICDGPISSTSFSNLSSIRIHDCNSLRNLGQLSLAGTDCLPQLETLIIKECAMMEQVFLWNDNEQAGKNKKSIETQRKRHVIFPKMKEVELYNLPNLTTLYQGIQGIEFPVRMKLKIEECPKMKSIIGSCSPDIDEHDSLHLLCQPQKVSFGSLKVLEINHNPFCRHEIPSSLFNGLKELTISKYVGSTSLFKLLMAANLVSLRELSIFNCDEMIKVIEDEKQQERILVFPKLETLRLKNLPKLVTFCDSKCEVELPSLEEVAIGRCPNMENFSTGLVATPNLEDFTTDLTTYVGVGVDVAFNSLKALEISKNENPFDHHKISISIFNGLEKLIVGGYKGNLSLFSCSAVGSLVNLRVLMISYCDEIVKVIDDEEEKEDGKVVSGGEIWRVVFPEMEEIRLSYLPNLVRFCEWKCDVELPSLTKVEIWKCPNMESFTMGILAAPKLKIVQIDHKEIDDTKDLNGALHQHYLARQEKAKKERRRRRRQRRRRRRMYNEENEIKEEEGDQN